LWNTSACGSRSAPRSTSASMLRYVNVEVPFGESTANEVRRGRLMRWNVGHFTAPSGRSIQRPPADRMLAGASGSRCTEKVESRSECAVHRARSPSQRLSRRCGSTPSSFGWLLPRRRVAVTVAMTSSMHSAEWSLGRSEARGRLSEHPHRMAGGISLDLAPTGSHDLRPKCAATGLMPSADPWQAQSRQVVLGSGGSVDYER
jgi:hypothetical protein